MTGRRVTGSHPDESGRKISGRGTRVRPVRARIASGMLFFYRNAVSPTLHAVAPGGCRFQPTCSEYAAIAVAEWGLVRGGWMALTRLLRCHPFSKGGFDPVPARDSESRRGGSE